MTDQELEEAASDGLQERLKSEASSMVKRLGIDSVQIFASQKAPEDSTRYFSAGSGNWCARYGAARLWVDEQKWSSD